MKCVWCVVALWFFELLCVYPKAFEISGNKMKHITCILLRTHLIHWKNAFIPSCFFYGDRNSIKYGLPLSRNVQYVNFSISGLLRKWMERTKIDFWKRYVRLLIDELVWISVGDLPDYRILRIHFQNFAKYIEIWEREGTEPFFS